MAALAAAHLGPSGGRARAAVSEEIFRFCSTCCTEDWCTCPQQSEFCDCHEVLAKLGYVLPATAAEAVARRGPRWAEALGWRAATVPGWLPAGDGDVVVRTSKLEGAGKGLFAQRALPKGAILPPYRGDILTFAGVGWRTNVYSSGRSDYVWCPRDTTRLLLNMSDGELEFGPKAEEASWCVDAKDDLEDNPTRFVNAAKSQAQCLGVNVQFCTLGNVLYFRTLQAVPEGTELLADYGGTYWQDFDGCL